MSEKVDLADFETHGGLAVLHTHELLALVAAVRAARALVNASGEEAETEAAFDALDAALAPFTDSAEVRSDGE